MTTKTLQVKIDRNTSDGYHSFEELYSHRHALFLNLLNSKNGSKKGAWKSRLHEDGTMFSGMFIAGFETPKGMITYHLPARLYKFAKVRSLKYAPKWDGHTSDDVVTRLMSML